MTALHICCRSAAVAQRLPAGEALAVARAIDKAGLRAKALAAVAERLPPKAALAVARGTDDAGWRAEALAAVAERLPAEDQPGVLGEALSAVRAIDDAESRAKALAAVTERAVTSGRAFQFAPAGPVTTTSP